MLQIPPAAAGLLTLPALDSLTAAQARGAVCVWGDTPLTTATAVDLGQQTAPGGQRWFPRACHSCTATHAYRALADHSYGCTVCRTAPPSDPYRCDIAHALHRLVRDSRTAARR